MGSKIFAVNLKMIKVTQLVLNLSVDVFLGLMFHNKYDRMLIRPDPYLRSPGNQTYRFRVFSKMYNNFVLYDHVMRCRK